MTVERLVSRVLLAGGVLSLVLLCLGLLVYSTGAERDAAVADLSRLVAHQSQGRPVTVYASLGEVVRALSHRPIDPLAVVALGLVLLAATPVVGVAVAAAAFSRAGDRDYAIISTVVLAVLALSFVLAGGVG